MYRAAVLFASLLGLSAAFTKTYYGTNDCTGPVVAVESASGCVKSGSTGMVRYSCDAVNWAADYFHSMDGVALTTCQGAPEKSESGVVGTCYGETYGNYAIDDPSSYRIKCDAVTPSPPPASLIYTSYGTADCSGPVTISAVYPTGCITITASGSHAKSGMFTCANGAFGITLYSGLGCAAAAVNWADSINGTVGVCHVDQRNYAYDSTSFMVACTASSASPTSSPSFGSKGSAGASPAVSIGAVLVSFTAAVVVALRRV